MSPLEYAEQVSKEADDNNGFNMIVADLCTRSMFCISNRPKGKPISVKAVSPDLHVLSNARHSLAQGKQTQSTIYRLNIIQLV